MLIISNIILCYSVRFFLIYEKIKKNNIYIPLEFISISFEFVIMEYSIVIMTLITCIRLINYRKPIDDSITYEKWYTGIYYTIYIYYGLYIGKYEM
jgi:hypothetical protein